MQNDMLKNNIAPWQEKGRWYHGVWDATSRVVVSGLSDEYLVTNIGFSESGNTIFMYDKTKKIEFVDAKSWSYDNSYTCTNSATGSVGAIRNYVSGEIGVGVCSGYGVEGLIEFWIYGIERQS